MKKTLTILLAVLLLLGMAACGNAEENPASTAPQPTYSVSEYKSNGVFTEVQNQLTWEKINAIPIKSSDMTIDEARDLVVNFFRFTKTACWISDTTVDFVKNAKGSDDIIERGVVYGGLPYVGVGSGNVYRILDYMDPETGVVDITNAVDKSKPYDGWKLFGNQCSIGAYWGWGRVINSAYYKWTQNMVEKNGFIRVGDYEYDLELTRVGGKTGDKENPNTIQILFDNGKETMYKAYAQIKKGDGLVYYTTAGHVIMSATDAHVEYVDEAQTQIDPAKSFITIIDQGQTWEEMTNEQGDYITYKGGVDVKKSFLDLFAGNYMPFTFGEFLGTDPIEDTVCEFSHTGDTITVDELFESVVTCNYGLSDIYAIVRDAKGNEVYKHAIRTTVASNYKMQFVRSLPEDKAVNYVEFWGYLEPELTAEDNYTVEIVAQIATGERPSLYKGHLLPGAPGADTTPAN